MSRPRAGLGREVSEFSEVAKRRYRQSDVGSVLNSSNLHREDCRLPTSPGHKISNPEGITIGLTPAWHKPGSVTVSLTDGVTDPEGA